MTSPPAGPPPEETPDDDGHQNGVPPGYPAPPPGSYGYPYGPPPPPYGQPYPHGQPYPPPRPERRISVGMAFAGSAAYFAINLLLALVIISIAGSSADSGRIQLAFGALVLALIAFGGGGGLLATGNVRAKGLGLGLMIGWAITSLVSVGYCTGINPTMYTS